jgi:hypothetical protein
VYIEFGGGKEPDSVFLIMVEAVSLSRALSESKFGGYQDYYREHERKDLISKRTTKDRILTRQADARLPDQPL